MTLPVKYSWLLLEKGPKMLAAALELYGIREKARSENNPIIMGWARELGFKQYTGDSIPWCGLFMAHVASIAGKPLPPAPLWARNWATFGQGVDKPGLGDVLVFTRGTGGHVGLYVGEDTDCYHVLGGNQGDAVSIVRIEKNRLLAARSPRWKIAEPKNRRRIYLKADGAISKNEA